MVFDEAHLETARVIQPKGDFARRISAFAYGVSLIDRRARGRGRWPELLSIMAASIQRETNDIYALRLSGTVLRSEIAAVQDKVAVDIDAGTRPRILALLENFEGFERGADWGDLDFLFSHINDIAKIAIVGEPSWERDTLAFAGAGSRKAPVKFFPSNQLAVAREWIA